jgi:hypothetical protein
MMYQPEVVAALKKRLGDERTWELLFPCPCGLQFPNLKPPAGWIEGARKDAPPPLPHH